MSSGSKSGRGMIPPGRWRLIGTESKQQQHRAAAATWVRQPAASTRLVVLTTFRGMDSEPPSAHPVKRPAWVLAVLLAAALHGMGAWSLLHLARAQDAPSLPIAVELIERVTPPTAPPAPAPSPAAETPPPPMPTPQATRPKAAQRAPVAKPDPVPARETATDKAMVTDAPEPVPFVPANRPHRVAPLPAVPPPDLAVHCPNRPAPAYPPAARRAGHEGSVLLQVTLGPSGRIAGVSIEQSSGAATLDRAAVAAVRRWRCRAPQTGGPAQRAVLRQRIDFALR